MRSDLFINIPAKFGRYGDKDGFRGRKSVFDVMEERNCGGEDVSR